MTRLERLLQSRRADLAAAKRLVPAGDLRRKAAHRRDRRDFMDSLRASRTALIAEYKRASPTAGVFMGAPGPATAARAYAAGGAAAVSVVTEPWQFRGSLDDLSAARAACDLPVLCKDFIVDEYQLWAAAAAGADAVLLIAAALDDRHLSVFVQRASLLGMATVVEVHDEGELARAVSMRPNIIGVNNRDLRTFRVDTSVALRLRPAIPPRVPAIAESGYDSPEAIKACAESGYAGVLVGEALMRAADSEEAVRYLLAGVR